MKSALPENVPRVGGLVIPPDHIVRYDSLGLPVPTDTILRATHAQHRNARFGIVALIAVGGRLLVAEHRAAPKTAAGMLGFMSETLQGRLVKGEWDPEEYAQAITRCIREELGSSQADLGPLRRSACGFRDLGFAPSGLSGKTTHVLATALHLSDGFDPEKYAATFTATDEVGRIEFMGLSEIERERSRLRPGTWSRLMEMIEAGFLDPANTLAASLPEERADMGMADIDLAA